MYRSEHILKKLVECRGSGMIGQCVRYIFKHHGEEVGQEWKIPVSRVVADDKQVVIVVRQLFTDSHELITNCVASHLRQFAFAFNHVFMLIAIRLLG